jgi:hypothetical protein
MASFLLLLTPWATALDDPLLRHRENPQLWFSDLPADLPLAKAYCQPCPAGLTGRCGRTSRSLGRRDLPPRPDHHGKETARPASRKIRAGEVVIAGRVPATG